LFLWIESEIREFFDFNEFGMRRAFIQSARDFGSKNLDKVQVGGWGNRKSDEPGSPTPVKAQDQNEAIERSFRDQGYPN
jgi:hypothetical protein